MAIIKGAELSEKRTMQEANKMSVINKEVGPHEAKKMTNRE